MKAERHLGLAIGAAAIMTMSIWLLRAVAVQGVESAPMAWTRKQEPVILTGGQIPLVIEAPLNEADQRRAGQPGSGRGCDAGGRHAGQLLQGRPGHGP